MTQQKWATLASLIMAFKEAQERQALMLEEIINLLMDEKANEKPKRLYFKVETDEAVHAECGGVVRQLNAYRKRRKAQKETPA